MNGYTFPRSGKHAASALSANRNAARKPQQWLNPTSLFSRLCFGAMTLFRMTRALPSCKLWRAVQRRRGARSNYYRNHQESGA